MLNKKLFSSSSIWKPKNPHSLEYLKYLHGVLQKNAVVTEQNRSLLVEALRAIAEILIWGDQNDASVFDFFLEKNMLGFFLRIMKQKCGRYVCVQLLQTLNILFENISSETSLYYLLSNNHVNSIITHRFDFSDEEILAYFISFLKTLSLKLNNNTIHFFFNEHTNDFPLYTEAIKFFNHSESMARIAVRTLTLNVYRVNDPSMLKFIRDKTGAPYFSNLVWFIGNHVVEIDAFIKKNLNTSAQVRDKLADLIAEHLDSIHYTNDILRLNIETLNEMLTEQMLTRLFIPLYLGSLIPDAPGDGPRITPVVALFLISQVFLVITHTPLVERLASMLFLGDRSLLENEDFTFRVGQSLFYTSENSNPLTSSIAAGNRTDEEKLQQSFLLKTTESLENQELQSRPWFHAVLCALDCSTSDHAAFFALCVLFCCGQNEVLQSQWERISPALMECAQIPHQNASIKTGYSMDLVQRLLNIISLSADVDCPVRIITLEMSCAVLKQMCLSKSHGSCLLDQHFAQLIAAREKVVQQLAQFVQQEEMFLDLFEDEFQQVQHRNLNIEFLSTDPSVLSCPSTTPLSGVEFVKRLPCGPQENARKAIRTYFILRQLLMSMTAVEDTVSPLFNSSGSVQLSDCLNLMNSDMLACTVVSNKDGSKVQRFLVSGGLQLMLVEPDGKKVGWGVVKFVGLLQDTDVTGDKDDSRSLFVTVHAPAGKARNAANPLLSAKLVFDDHIRCMAAKQRLTKGRQKARQYKMDLISQILELKSVVPEMPNDLAPLISSVNISGRNVPGYVAVSSSSSRSTNNPDAGPVLDASSLEVAVKDYVVETATAKELLQRQPSKSVVRRLKKRHIRVLSTDSVRCDSIPNDSINPAVSASATKSDNDDEQHAAFFNFGPRNSAMRRSNSLSPRIVPRLNALDAQESVDDNLYRRHDRSSMDQGNAFNKRISLLESVEPRRDRVSLSSNSSVVSNELNECDSSSSTTESNARGYNVKDDFPTNDATPSLQCFAPKRRSKSWLVHDI